MPTVPNKIVPLRSMATGDMFDVNDQHSAGLKALLYRLVWVVCSSSRLSGLRKRKIIADRQLWVENRQPMSDKVETIF